MKFIKPYFWYNKSQRNGVLFLMFLIVMFQLVIVFGTGNSDGIIDVNNKNIQAFQKQIDSLQKVELQNRVPKIYPFNPNYITDYKAEKLGMSIDEIDRLLAFRKTNKFINSKEDFERVTKIPDSLLNKIAPFFKFPDWVLKKGRQRKKVNKKYSQNPTFKSRKKLSTEDINKATVLDFKAIRGVGDKLSDRIINYRKRLQGFTFKEQLYEVWNLPKEVANRLLSVFKIIEKPVIKKQNINTVTFKVLLKNPYIDYNLCKKIFNYRDEIAEFQELSELKNINGFPLDKYSRIVLYLETK